MSEIVKISDLMDDYTLPQWVDFPGVDGFKVQVQLPDQAIKIGAMLERRGPAGQMVAPKMLAQYAVCDWEGLTVAGLKKLVAVSIKGEDNQVVPCSPDNVELLIKFSPAFYLFVLDQLNQREKTAAREVSELKN